MQKGQVLIFSMLIVAVIAFLGAIFYIGKQIPKPPQTVDLKTCSQDTDCQSEYICFDKRYCSLQGPNGASHCTNGGATKFCFKKCSGDSDCPIGTRCNLNRCLPS